MTTEPITILLALRKGFPQFDWNEDAVVEGKYKNTFTGIAKNNSKLKLICWQDLDTEEQYPYSLDLVIESFDCKVDVCLVDEVESVEYLIVKTKLIMLNIKDVFFN